MPGLKQNVFRWGRPAVALLLLLATLMVGVQREGPLEPVSMALARHEVAAILVLFSFALTLALLLWNCRRLGWSRLLIWGGTLLPVLAVIAFSPPYSKVHTWAFGILLAAGVPWLMTYAAAEERKSITVLTGLMIFAVLAIGFILGIAGGVAGSVPFSPVPLFQRGFLVLFAVMALLPQTTELYEGPDEEELPDEG